MNRSEQENALGIYDWKVAGIVSVIAAALLTSGALRFYSVTLQ